MSQQPPNDQEIRQMLIQLHDELERTDTLDENEQAMMRHLMHDIQELLKRSDRTGVLQMPPNKNFIDRVQESIDVLEVSHPTLTSMLVKALETLNIAGI